MNKLIRQLKRHFLLFLLICLRLFAGIGLLPELLFGLIVKTGKLILANIKLVLLSIAILLSWQFFVYVNSFLNSLPEFDFNVLNNLSVPSAILIYDQNNILLAKSNRDYHQIPVDLSQISPEVQKEQTFFYSQSLADRLLTENQSLKKTIKRNILISRINKMLSKEQVLTAYFNTLIFPDHIIGIEAASEYFLSKNAAKLSSEDYQYLTQVALSKESPTQKYQLYKRAPDAIDFVLSDLKSNYPNIWQNDQQISVLTSIDLKLQNYLQQFVLANLPSADGSGLAIIDPDSRFLKALVGHQVDSNKPEVFYSIKRITDLKQNILLQNDQKIPIYPPAVVSLKPGLNNKSLINQLNQVLASGIPDNHLVENQSEGR